MNAHGYRGRASLRGLRLIVDRCPSKGSDSICGSMPSFSTRSNVVSLLELIGYGQYRRDESLESLGISDSRVRFQRRWSVIGDVLAHNECSKPSTAIQDECSLMPRCLNCGIAIEVVESWEIEAGVATGNRA